MARILALDVGTKTIGVAVCDETETFVFPGDTIWRKEGYRRDMAVLRKLVADKQIDEIIVGLPLSMDGADSEQTLKVRRFTESLSKFVAVPVNLHDERLSTFEADQLLIETNVKRENRKKVIDSVAASVILQSYIDHRRSDNGE